MTTPNNTGGNVTLVKRSGHFSWRNIMRHKQIASRVLSRLLLSVFFMLGTAVFAQAAVTIGDVTVAEDGIMTFSATSADATAAFTVDVAFTDGGATGGGTDYDSSVQTLSFSGAAGETQTFTVPVNDDAVVEGSESFTVKMQNINPASTTDITDTAVGTITDNDTGTVTIADVTVAEDGVMTFTAAVDNAVEGGFSVDVAFSDTSATGGGTDYDSSVQTLNFAGTAAETQTFTVPLTDDAIVESSETFSVSQQNLVAPGTMDITDGAVGTITDNDTGTVTIADVTVAEDGVMTFTATVDNAVAGGFTVDVAFDDGTATGGGTDYDSTVQTLAFVGNAAETQNFTVPLIDDLLVEDSESFSVRMENIVSPGASNILDTAAGTITDNDTSEVSVTATAAAGEPGTDGEFTLTLSNAASTDTVISYTVGAATTAISDVDYTALSGTATIPANAFTTVVPVPVIDDVIVEGPEILELSVTATSNGQIAVAAAPGDSAQFSFGDDDVAVMTVDDVSVLENGTMQFTASVGKEVDGGFTIDVDFTDGGAVGGSPLAAGIDYENSVQTLTFTGNANETQTFIVPLNNDSDVELAEDFVVNFTNPVPAKALVGQFDMTDTGTGTILNDEHLIAMTAGNNGGMDTTYDGTSVVGPGSTTVQIAHADTPQFNINPDFCYHVTDVQVNGSSEGAVTSYTFPPVVTENQTISADFALNEYTITATVLGNNGTLTPGQTVDCNTSGYVYDAQADAGYHITWLKVNGVEIPAAAGQTAYTYTFSSAITSDQTIEVAYTQILTIIEESPFGEVVPDGDANNHYEVDYGSDLVLSVSAYVPCPDGFAHDGNDHHVSDILLDDVSVSGVKGSGLTTYTYTLANITEEHSIEILFTSYVDVTVHPNGHTESPVINTDASIEVEAKTDQDITAVPDTGFHVSGVLIDGAPVGAPEVYTFSELTDDDHTYEVSFAIDTFTLEPASRFDTIFDTSAESVVAATRLVDYGTDSSFYVNLNDPDHVVLGILVDNVSYPMPATGTSESYTDFVLTNTGDDYLEVKFTNVVVSHRLEVLDYDSNPISDFPLDAKLRPKPASLMFVLDDSGSMDWEFLVPGDGLYKGLAYVYSYPSVREARVYGDYSIENWGWQGQWRSQWSATNKMFYNPDVTFTPWPNFIGSSPSSNLPAAASSVAGQSDGQSHANLYRPRYHPWYSQDCIDALNRAVGTTPDNLNTCDDNETFDMDDIYMLGIINAHYYTWDDVDGDDVIDYNDSNNNGQLDLDETVNETIWLVNLTDPIEYYRVIDNSKDVSAGNLVAVAAGDVPATVKTYAEPTDSDAWVKERQNWADWFSYYRKRTYSATAAVAQVIDQMSEVEVGFHTINYWGGGWKGGGYGISQSLLPLKVAGKGNEKNTLLELLYGFQINGYGTPLRRGLESVGEYYDDTDGNDNGGIENNSGSSFGTPIESPFHAKEDGDACKQVFTIAMTDGYWNGGDPNVGNADGDNGAPYADNYSNTLADVAMDFFERDLSSMDDLVPDGTNTHQHMVTYTVAFGVKGTLDPDDYDLNNAVYPTWPSPWSSSEARIDDLWHAAVNGHGSYMNASRPDELVASLLAIMKDIGARIGSGASVSVNGDEMYESINGQIRMFQTTYNSGDWHGDLQAYQVDSTTGEVLSNSPVWSAEEKMAAQLNATGANGRVIATYDGSKGVPFRWDDGGGTKYLSSVQQKQLFPYFEDTLTGEDVVDYLRGDRTNEGSFRGRDASHPLGDFIHSLARYDNGFLYVGGNDGMLHAFYADDADGGKELFAYVPSFVYGNLRQLANPFYSHKFFVDNTPFTKKFTDTTLLVGGLGKGGSGYYCLDITDPTDIASAADGEAEVASRVKWEYPGPPETLLTGSSFTFSSGTGSDGNDRILDSDEKFTEGNGFKKDKWITVIGANDNGYTNDGIYKIEKVDEDGAYIEIQSGSLIDGTGDGEDIIITRAVGDSGLGYSFSRAVIVKSADSSINAGTEFEGYVVIFGNGYGSEDGTASLYILDPVSGKLIEKIETDVGPFNGMSTPKAVDYDLDLMVDYVYAGDLLGNMWKFDLTSDDHDDWQVAYCDGGDSVGGNHCKDSVSGMKPQPLFSGLADQAITGAPDIMYQKSGYGFMVLFGTGKYLGEPDLSSMAVQSLYGIWDWAPDYLDEGYNGARVDTTGTPFVATLSNWPETDIMGDASNTLLQQVSWIEGQLTEDTDGDGKLDVDEDLNSNGVLDSGEDLDGDGHLDYEEDTNDNNKIDLYDYYRITSNFQGDFSLVSTQDLVPGHHLYNQDINGDGSVNERDKVPVANVGWFYDLPGIIDFDGDQQDNDKDLSVDEDDNGDGVIDERKPGERVVNDAIIRNGRVIFLSFGVTGTGCSAGAYSFVNERNPYTGGMLLQPTFDIDLDGEVNEEDMVYAEVPFDVDGDGDIDKDDVVAGVPTDRAYEGRLFNPAILREDESVDDDGEELKYFSDSQGAIQTMTEKAEKRGIYYWQQVE